MSRKSYNLRSSRYSCDKPIHSATNFPDSYDESDTQSETLEDEIIYFQNLSKTLITEKKQLECDNNDKKSQIRALNVENINLRQKINQLKIQVQILSND